MLIIWAITLYNLHMNQLFTQEISIVLKNYPFLAIKRKNGKDYLKGILDISDVNENIVT